MNRPDPARPDPARPDPARPGRNAMLSHFLTLNNSESIHASYFKFYKVVDTSVNCILPSFGAPISNIIDTRRIFVDQKFK